MERALIMMHELLDSGLLGEGLLSGVRHAWRHLLAHARREAARLARQRLEVPEGLRPRGGETGSANLGGVLGMTPDWPWNFRLSPGEVVSDLRV